MTCIGRWRQAWKLGRRRCPGRSKQNSQPLKRRKSEGRNPKSDPLRRRDSAARRNPKPEIRNDRLARAEVLRFEIRISFGPRPSGFGFHAEGFTAMLEASAFQGPVFAMLRRGKRGRRRGGMENMPVIAPFFIRLKLILEQRHARGVSSCQSCCSVVRPGPSGAGKN
jgi:hypothetical protein